MPLRNDLLNPVPGDKPAGANLKYLPVYDKIREARREDDDAPQGDWKHERKVADWPLTIKLISEAIATQSKDLQLAAWLAEAMLRREGVGGLREVLDLTRGLIENFWDGLYPELEDGDAEARTAPVQWIGDRLEMAIKRAPLTKSGKDWFQYQESRTLGTAESADTDEKLQSRLEKIAEGKIPQEVFDKEFEETSKAFYVKLLENFDGALESVSALGTVCDAKFGDLTPSFGTLRQALEEVRQTVYILLQKKRETEPDEPVAEAPVYEEAAPEGVAEPGTHARAPVLAGGLSIEPVDRDDAIRRVVSAAKYLRQQDTYSPAPYLLLRGLRWGELRAAGPALDQTLLAAPPSDIRQNLKRLSLEANWTEVLETAEIAMGMECGRGWLDLQRYVGRACYELGSSYDPILQAVISVVRGLLADYPQLTELTMMDDTPTANPETMAWIKEHVGEGGNAPVHPGEGYSTSAAPGGETGALPPDVFDLAMKAARAGHPQEGIELLMREMAQERTGRGRFERKGQLARLCTSTGHDDVAFPILQEMAAEIERRKLEDWEAPDWLAQPLALFYKCLSKNDATQEERQKLYSWICRLDPLQALNVTR